MDQFDSVCGLEGNHRLLHFLVIAISKTKVSTWVGVVQEIELGEDTVCIVGIVGNRSSIRAEGSKEETVVVLIARSGWKKEITDTASFVREGVIGEEEHLSLNSYYVYI